MLQCVHVVREANNNFNLDIRSNLKMRTNSKQGAILEALQSGARLTSTDIKTTFGVSNPGAAIQAIKFAGYPVFLNTVGKKGEKTKVYTMGTKAPREVIAAGYRALATRTA